MDDRLEELFPDEDYRFHMGLRRGDLRSYCSPSDSHARILEERRQFIAASPEHYLAWSDEAAPALGEFTSVLQGHDLIRLPLPAVTPLSGCGELAAEIEADFVLLKRDSDGMFRVVGGAVVFPSWWSLPEKLGLPIAQVHSVVPGLNPALERQINAFLVRVSPGVLWLRENWGLARTPELNAHPSRNLPRLGPPLRVEEVWIRVEYQSFLALPEAGALAFMIRVRTYPLAAASAEIARGLGRALRTMPEEVARYKGLSAARDEILRLLEAD